MLLAARPCPRGSSSGGGFWDGLAAVLNEFGLVINRDHLRLVRAKAARVRLWLPSARCAHQMIFKFVGDVTGRDRIHEIALDGSKNPAVMDMTRTVRGKAQTVFAIYKIEGDRL
jgi:hypothetical protein